METGGKQSTWTKSKIKQTKIQRELNVFPRHLNLNITVFSVVKIIPYYRHPSFVGGGGKGGVRPFVPEEGD